MTKFEGTMKTYCSSIAAAFILAACVAGTPTLQPASFHEEDVLYASGDIQLAAALLIPDGRGPFPAAVIIQGSGDSDRSNGWARAWAEALARRGIAALLTDKRGSGKSGGDWKTVGFETLAADAVAGVEYLRSHRSVRRRDVGVVGLSQGGHIAPVAGTSSDHVAFVVNISGSSTLPVEQVNHEMRNTFRQAGLDKAGVDAGMRIQALAERYLKTGDWDSYRSALTAALNTPLKPVAEGFPQTPDSWVWGWWRLVGDFDPIAHWRALKVAGLVIYGELDEQDNVPVAESVRRLKAVTGKDLTVRVVEGTGHALRDQNASDRQLRADAVSLLASWIHEKVN
ncbi:MAG: alpha/beta hydrolase family protein [Gemmatimonadaceae bacterium]